MTKTDAMEARIASMKQALTETREALAHSRERQQLLSERVEKLEDRLHRYKHAALSDDVLHHLLPARAAAWKRQQVVESTGHRDQRHVAISESYRREAARVGPIAEVAHHVSILGLEWSLPQDRGPAGRLTERMLSDRGLPLADILQTREVAGGGVMLDIGANIGTTCIPRAILGDAAVVYGAEPEPHNFACLVRNVIDNGLRGVVLPDQVAITDVPGRVSLRLAATMGAHMLGEPAGGEDSVDVEALTLDSWVARLGIDLEAIRLIKVDVQGRESHVLSGASDLLARHHIAWQLEFAPSLLQESGRSAHILIEQLRASFSWFIDMNGSAPPPRVRPIDQLADALNYADASFTNLIVYRS